MAEAFRLRLLLDEEPAASDERERRRLLTEILRLSTAADGRLDAEADAFDELRQTEANLEQELPRLRERAQALTGRLPEVEATLAQLRGRYAGAVLTAVLGNPEQAAPAAHFATAALDRAARPRRRATGRPPRWPSAAPSRPWTRRARCSTPSCRPAPTSTPPATRCPR